MFIRKYDQFGNLISATEISGGVGYGASGNSVAIDLNDNLYIAGSYQGTTDFDPSAGVDNKISNGVNDIFLTKINSDGSYGWTKTIGGSSGDYASSIVIDSANNIYLTGMFSGKVDFDPSAGVDSVTSSGWNDIFITKFDSTGGYIWSKVFYSLDGDNDVENIIHDSNASKSIKIP